MAKKTVFSNPVAKESLPRNSFPMSFVKNLNFSAGMLVPTFVKFVHGHSHVRLNQQTFMRTADVNTAAFPPLPMYTDFYFVPCTQIMSNWNDFKTHTNDQYSASLPFPRALPSFSVTEVNNIITSEAVDGSGYYDYASGAIRLFDLLGYGFNYNHLIGRQNVPLVGRQNVLFACAYQKVYYDHYRNTAYEQNDVFAYNIDDKTASQSSSFLSNDRLLNMFKLRYVNYRRDALNTIYPSLNFVAYSAGGMELRQNLPDNLLGLVGSPNIAETPDFEGIAPNIDLSNTILEYPAGFTLDNMRAAYALEKLLRVSSFAPQHVVDQFQARFGYRPKSASMRESIRLKSFKNDIIIGEVTATAETGSDGAQRLGSIGGKGVGASSPDYALSYDTPEDGILIGVSYVLPELTYDSSRVDLVNMALSAEDFALPEYANLGLQPVFMKNVRTITEDDFETTPTSSQLVEANNKILGLQPRDMQFKSSVSTNHGLFLTNNNLSPFVVHGLKDFPNRGTQYTSNGLDMYYFKCLPSDLDSIFVTAYPKTGDEKYDQFYGHFEYRLNIIQDKPIFGIPNL